MLQQTRHGPPGQAATESAPPAVIVETASAEAEMSTIRNLLITACPFEIIRNVLLSALNRRTLYMVGSKRAVEGCR
jgi:hypothetical protein